MTDPIQPLLSEVIAIHVGERFSRPPRVVVVCNEKPRLPIALPAKHIIQVQVWVQTHFGSIVRAEIIHGWHSYLINVEQVFSAVDIALDQALSQPGPNYLGDTISYLTDKDSWNLFDDDDDSDLDFDFDWLEEDE